MEARDYNGHEYFKPADFDDDNPFVTITELSFPWYLLEYGAERYEHLVTEILQPLNPVRIVAEGHDDIVTSMKYGMDGVLNIPLYMPAEITQVLPVVMAADMLTAGYTLYLEQPDAFLSGDAQANLFDFLCEKAVAGLNIVVTTHSPSSLGQVRVNVHEKKISPDDVTLIFEGKRLNIDSDGHIDEWPDGFMDTYDKQLMKLL